MSAEDVRVLLVEDNPIDVEAVRRAFVRHKLENPLVRAFDGVDALRQLRSGEVARPYVILLDLNMPRMSGIEFLRELRADVDLRDSVVFVLTTSHATEDRSASYDFNVAGYMVKSEVGPGFVRLTDLLGAYCDVVELPCERAAP